MTDRQPKSVTVPQECRHGVVLNVDCPICRVEFYAVPAPAPEAPPEWCRDAANDLGFDTRYGTLPERQRLAAHLIHVRFLASEEARKVEEPKVWLVMEAYAPTDSEDGPRLSTIHATKEGAEDDARRRNAVCDPDEGYIYSVDGPWLIHR